VTTTSNELTVPRRGLLAAVRDMRRNEFFAGLYILGCANGLVGRSLYTFSLEGWTGAVAGLEMNVIVLFACFVGVYLIASGNRDHQERIRGWDLVVGLVFLGIVILPSYPLSWVAVTGLSLYILFFANDVSERRRSALVLLALAFPMLWSRLIFQLFARPLLELDATMVTWLLGTERIGTTVRFADNSGYMVISPACASWGNISYVFLCWIAVTQWANHRWSPKDLLWLSLACVSLVAVNVTRIAVTGLSYAHYETIHNQYGEAVLGTIGLCLIIGFTVMGSRRELFSRA
jgi:exosortase/archaeosortase family protein